jgi:hypothetical protein
MKTLLAFVITCLFWTPAANAQARTDREQAGLIGPVKSVEAYVIHFGMKDGKTTQGSRQPWYAINYNIDGNITERVSYDHTGNMSARYFYAYDLKGRCIGYEEYASIVDKTLATPRKHTYTLNDNGNRIEYKVIGSDGTPDSRFTYKYDAKGNEIEYRWYSHTGLLGGVTASTYDESGNQTGQIAYRADDSIIWRNSSIFNGARNRIEQIRYEGDTLRYKIISRYDEKKRVLEEDTMEFNASPNVIRGSHAPVPGKVIYTYDDEKRTKEVASYNPDGSLKERIVYTYDDKWNQIGRAAFESDGTPNYTELQFYEDINDAGSRFLGKLSGKSQVEFEYDSHGNWTRKTHLIQSGKDDKPQRYQIEERVITYH